MTLANLIKRLEDIMRADNGIDGTAQRLSQIVWILFLKVFDYKEEEAELDDGYEPVIPEGYRWRDWVPYETATAYRTGDELLDFVNNDLIHVLRGEPTKDASGAERVLFASESPRALLVKEFMQRTHNYAQNGVQLRQVLDLFEEVDFSDADDTHEFNDVYETMLKSLQGAGKAGEFYTPRAVTSFAIERVDPKIGETVGDFACGTCGFLVDALRHMEAQIAPGDTEALETIHSSLIGSEWKPMPYMLGVTNLMLHGVELPNVTYGDSLVKRLLSYDEADCVDVIAMNPPYGGVTTEANRSAYPAEFRSSESADLFVAQIMTRLRPGGRAVVVLPNGFLEGEDNVRIALKKKLLGEFNLHTVIRMPESVFAPYTSIETNLLFFDNTGSTQETWFYRFDKPEGYKHFSKTRPLMPKHMEVVSEWWGDRVEISDEDTDTYKAKRYSVEELVGRNYNLALCGYPTVEEEVLSPEETIAAYRIERERVDADIDAKLAEIERILGIEVGE